MYSNMIQINIICISYKCTKTLKAKLGRFFQDPAFTLTCSRALINPELANLFEIVLH